MDFLLGICIGLIFGIVLGILGHTFYIVDLVKKKYGNIEVGSGTIDFLINNVDKNKLSNDAPQEVSE